jgi:hypothetical protein
LADYPATPDRTQKKEGKGEGKKNTKAAGEREIYRTCRDETEMAEKPNMARDPYPLSYQGSADKYEWQGLGKDIRMFLSTFDVVLSLNGMPGMMIIRYR